MAQSSRVASVSDLTRVEDYLEVVYDLIQTKGYARVTDIDLHGRILVGLVVSFRLGPVATAVHTAPLSRVVLRFIQTEPITSLARACEDVLHHVRSQKVGG